MPGEGVPYVLNVFLQYLKGMLYFNASGHLVTAAQVIKETTHTHTHTHTVKHSVCIHMHIHTHTHTHTRTHCNSSSNTGTKGGRWEDSGEEALFTNIHGK